MPKTSHCTNTQRTRCAEGAWFLLRQYLMKENAKKEVVVVGGWCDLALLYNPPSPKINAGLVCDNIGLGKPASPWSYKDVQKRGSHYLDMRAAFSMAAGSEFARDTLTATTKTTVSPIQGFFFTHPFHSCSSQYFLSPTIHLLSCLSSGTETRIPSSVACIRCGRANLFSIRRR